MGTGLKRHQLMAAFLAMACGISCCAAQGFIQVSQQLLNFGDVAVLDHTDLQTITLQNYGNPASLPLITIKPMAGSPDGQFTLMGGTCTTLTAPLQATATCTLLVKANPSVAGTVQAVLQATANSDIDGIFNAQPVMLTANGVIPQLIMAPALDFGNVPVGTTSAPQSIFVLNTGTVRTFIVGGVIQINPITGANTAQLTITGGTCFNTDVIMPSQSCSFTVTAIPTVAGRSTQQLVLKGPGGTAYAPVKGSLALNGVSPTLPAAPSPSPSPKPSPSPRRHHTGK